MQVNIIEDLRLKLTKNGVAAKYVDRSVMELKAHHDDLTSRELREGRSETEAEIIASKALGDEGVILREILSKKELKTRSYRYPKTTFIGIPTLLVILVTILSILLPYLSWVLVGASTTYEFASEVPSWILVVIDLLQVFHVYIVGPAVALSFWILGHKRYVKMPSVYFGMILVLFVSSAYSIELGIGNRAGDANFSIGIQILYPIFGLPAGPESIQLAISKWIGSLVVVGFCVTGIQAIWQRKSNFRPIIK